MPTILYAEDDEGQRSMMRLVLKDLNVLLLEAADGLEALSKIERQQPDLILLDLFMPRLDGLGLLETIKSNPDINHIPIIVLSAWPTGDNRDRARRAGAADFITKPFEPTQLKKAIKKHLTMETVLVQPGHED
jgi:two-component system chemotaxis response regulator CheY